MPSRVKRPSGARPPKKTVPDKRGGAAARHSASVRVRWNGIEHLDDGVKRFYKIETLASAVEYLIQNRDSFIVPSIQASFEREAVASLDFDFFAELPGKLMFRVRASTAKRKTAMFAFVVAKNADPFSKHLAAEHANLKHFHARAPESIMQPLRGGRIYLPDRHQRAGYGREVYGFMAKWPTGHTGLGMGKGSCFVILGQPLQPLLPAQTDDVKAALMAIVARTYDAARRDAIVLPEAVGGDVVVTRPGRGSMKVKLVACRGVRKNLTPAKLVHAFASTTHTWHGEKVHFAPNDPERFYSGLVQGVGAETAAQWLAAYREAVAKGHLPEQDRLPLAALDALKRALD
jgi:hypothetical protein